VGYETHLSNQTLSRVFRYRGSKAGSSDDEFGLSVGLDRETFEEFMNEKRLPTAHMRSVIFTMPDSSFWGQVQGMGTPVAAYNFDNTGEIYEELL